MWVRDFSALSPLASLENRLKAGLRDPGEGTNVFTFKKDAGADIPTFFSPYPSLLPFWKTTAGY